jgi:hypothetical protein
MSGLTSSCVISTAKANWNYVVEDVYAPRVTPAIKKGNPGQFKAFILR